MGEESNDQPDAVNPSQTLPSPQYPAPGVVLQGTVLVLLQFDVCESIDLDRLRDLLPQHSAVALKANPIAPGYVRYQRPPVSNHWKRWCWRVARHCPEVSSITTAEC